MRCDQFIGLPKHAIDFLKEWEQKCCACRQSLPGKRVIGHYVGMFDSEYPLMRYSLIDGRYADEFLQAMLWSNGPMFFLGLQVSGGQQFRWTQEEIDKAC